MDFTDVEYQQGDSEVITGVELREEWGLRGTDLVRLFTKHGVESKPVGMTMLWDRAAVTEVLRLEKGEEKS